ncbi:tetratricopeptide repeat protein [Neobacillus sp. PS3-12]|uniref:tetratricopeptide repeat protein n=1 Tax=Neobacillus sp. PS3-12 TaxID=3070677 RepID=UPI0027DF917D|nr:tetratricopeptide repeat protein [Neobacillus sp. PS3-12]WML54731.1 tetratricopeptide repeat protein [Neobacillus sp. PS3-12]
MKATQPINPEPENNERTQLQQEKKKSFSKLQSFLLIFATLVISLGAGYFICNKYVWPSKDEARLYEQVDYYKGLVDKKPNNPENRVNLGYSYFLTGDTDNAVKQLQVAINLDNKNFGAYFNLGLVYNSEKRYNDAIRMAQKAETLGPKNFQAHLLSGMVYRNLKQYDKALKSLQSALKIMPTNTDIITEIGRVKEDQGNNKEAEKFFKEALSYDPLYKPASQGLERVAAKQKDNK